MKRPVEIDDRDDHIADDERIVGAEIERHGADEDRADAPHDHGEEQRQNRLERHHATRRERSVGPICAIATPASVRAPPRMIAGVIVSPRKMAPEATAMTGIR